MLYSTVKMDNSIYSVANGRIIGMLEGVFFNISRDGMVLGSPGERIQLELDADNNTKYMTAKTDIGYVLANDDFIVNRVLNGVRGLAYDISNSSDRREALNILDTVWYRYKYYGWGANI